MCFRTQIMIFPIETANHIANTPGRLPHSCGKTKNNTNTSSRDASPWNQFGGMKNTKNPTPERSLWHGVYHRTNHHVGPGLMSLCPKKVDTQHCHFNREWRAEPSICIQLRSRQTQINQNGDSMGNQWYIEPFYVLNLCIPTSTWPKTFVVFGPLTQWIEDHVP